MIDVVTLVLLAASFFFVATSVSLLYRYRQASQKINASTDLGRDLWSSLEQRLRKQDERILDVMARLEVVQARVMTISAVQASPVIHPTISKPTSSSSMPVRDEPPPVTEPDRSKRQSEASQAELHVESQESQESQVRSVSPLSQASSEPTRSQMELDETQLAALKLLSEGPKSTRQLTDLLKKSREHTARLMKVLFSEKLVTRDDTSKPFVYQLSDEGERRLSTGKPLGPRSASGSP